jgi:hypothetical protein
MMHNNNPPIDAGVDANILMNDNANTLNSEEPGEPDASDTIEIPWIETKLSHHDVNLLVLSGIGSICTWIAIKHLVRLS